MESKKSRWNGLIVFSTLITIVYSIVLVWFYREQLNPSLNIQTDFGAQIQLAITHQRGTGGYSLMRFVWRFIWPLPYHVFLASLIFTAFTCLSIYFTFKLLKYLLPKGNNAVIYAASLLANMQAPIYLPALNSHRYLGSLSFCIYHNPTYAAMRAFAILSLLIFFRLRNKYRHSGIRLIEWLVFAAALFLTTGMKPSFMLGFAPCMFIAMLADFIEDRGKHLFHYISFGTTVFPSLLLMLWQQWELFEDPANVGGGIGFSFFGVWKLHAQHPGIYLLSSIAFPIVILILYYKDFIKDKVFRFGWLFAIINIMIFAFLCETGIRFADGNFAWGACFAVGMLFILSLYKFISGIHTKSLLSTVIASGVLGMHLLCWFNFLSLYIKTGTYLM